MQIKDINKLLIIRLSSLGDILLTTPLIRSVKNQFPSVGIDFILREEYYDVMKLNPYLNQVYNYSNDRNQIKEFMNSIANNKYDLVIDLQHNLRSKELLKQFNGTKLLFNKKTIYKFLLVHFKINRMGECVSIPERYAQTVNSLLLDENGLDLYTDRTANPVLKSDEKIIGLCPGSKHFTKMWLLENFISLGNLLEENGYTVVLFGGNDDRQICESISYKLNRAINLCNDNNILQTAADLIMCKAVYCNDSGMMHAASAVNVPVISFFGSTVKEFGFAPYNCKNLILENNFLTCRPCSHIGRENCPKKHFNCMKQISPQTAFDSLHLIFDK